MAARARRFRRALLDSPAFGEPVIVCGNAEPCRRVAGGPVHSPEYRCEAAGTAFAARYEGAAPTSPAGESRRAASESSSDDEEEYGRERTGKEKSALTFKMSELLKGVNLYELLGVSEGATQDEIKKAYRGLVLSAHPDKQGTTDPSKLKSIQERFVQIQEAYELLADPAKRLQYDSSLEFDESLPRFKPDAGQDFYAVFGEAFRRNARFSVRRPVPEIGGPETPADEWRRFYNFWHEFQSWRDPVVLAQSAGEEIFDLAEAECREERRWMQRENARMARSYKQAERDRISSLVAMAEKYDPRIEAEKTAKKRARQAEAQRREEERLAIERAREEEERLRREAEEAAKAAEAERRREEKALKEAAKAGLKKCRQRLRGFHATVQDLVDFEQLNAVCLGLEEAALQDLANAVELALKEGSAAAAGVIHRAIESIGLKPVVCMVKADDDTASTSSGPSQSSQGEDPEEVRRREEERTRRAKEAEARRAAEQAAKEEERVRREAEKAEEKRKRDELRRKEQQQAEAKKRQQEKKEEEKARKAEEKRQKEEEQEALRREQQRQEDRQRALEQAERDRQQALARQEELENERQLQLFSTDRMDRMAQLQRLSDDEMAAVLAQAVETDASLRGALFLLRQRAETDELSLDRAVALVHQLGPEWPLGLASPGHLRLANALRNQVKKARLRIHGAVSALLAKHVGSEADAKEVTDWQRGIVDGSVELPVWPHQDNKAAEATAAAAVAEKPAEAAPPANESPTGKKGKKAKEPKAEEDLDQLLAEFGMAPDTKKGGKKKK